ncbi:ribonuclease R [Paucidesulfovibrio gracilis DSM 16080]|uniref:Ribonuclease R n=1 Tax=Paucidesulfovibrio gracilis DSM 16080 TaxID=1121449 RepID=A0A1T4W9V8_9BACT|nr:ribonuclease R [Paucidesulfovibrio gracilis]SKA74066.1 ribonuclease R [Paucidesulfovibrio gracilis DSM 16080]
MAGKRKKTKKNHRGNGLLNEAGVLAAFRQGARPLTRADIGRALQLKKRDRPALREILKTLVDKGKLIRTRGAYGLVDKMRLVTGRLEVKRSGVGFVIPEDSRRKDLFISEKDLGEAWHGDRVVAAVLREHRKKNNEGRIVRILERGRQTLTARVVRRVGGGAYLTRPTDPLLGFGMVVEIERKLRPGQIVVVTPGERLEPHLWEAAFQELLGNEEDLAVQEALVKATHQVPTKFPQTVLDEAATLPTQPDENDFRDRRDLRTMDFVTIDGATAKDFDDAIFVERRGKKGYRLWVAIADVSHYVRPGSDLDQEAYERGNSYYFPLSVEPMFPERLSNGLCSLNPNTPRLVMAVSIDFSDRGEPAEAEYFPAVIQSKARLTYGQIKRALLEKQESERQQLGPVLPMLELAEELTRKIKQRRSERGSLDFDLPEADIRTDENNRIAELRPLERHFGHQLIEECMVAANEAVARFLESAGPGCLFRIHPQADAEKLERLAKVLRRTSPELALPERPDIQDLQKLLHKAESTEWTFLVNRLLLRSMMQAQYSPENEGHYGLASESYCHFTSPIRRYADLVVHRLLKSALGDGSQPVPNRKRLRNAADQVNSRERRATDAEREIHRRAAALFLRQHEGDHLRGVISSVTDYGFRVELLGGLAEGTVRLSSLNDDYYAYWRDREILVGERTGRMFRLGQEVEVILEEVRLDQLEADLTLVRSLSR